jgi:hypothetical protein
MAIDQVATIPLHESTILFRRLAELRFSLAGLKLPLILGNPAVARMTGRQSRIRQAALKVRTR